jgi:hypothetical protein
LESVIDGPSNSSKQETMALKSDLETVHKKSRRNRLQLADSKSCGCFYCLKEFPFSQIADWIDDSETARCPYCGIDAVLGFDTETADQALLQNMHEHWFENTIRLTPEEWKRAVERKAWPASPQKFATRK